MKTGLDDYLMVYSADEFRELLKTAKPPVKPALPAPTESNDEKDDPHRLARRYLSLVSPDGPPFLLRHWRGGWLHYDGAAYSCLPDGDQRGGVTDFVRDEFVKLNLEEVKRWLEEGGEGSKPATRKVTTRLVSDVEQALRGVCLLPASVNSPAWIGEPGEPDPQLIMPMRNGLLDLSKQVLIPATPNFFSQNSVPYDFDRAASEPRKWLQFLGELWPDDPDSIAALQEWFGYSLTPDTRLQKILFILGPKRSGKGTIARVLRWLVGEANVAGPTLGSLASPFGLQPLLGKPVAIISDAQLSGRADAAIITERLKAISGEDAITVDRKHKEALTVKLPTRFMILANELPRLGDASGAIASRLIILRLTRSWYGNEDHELSERLQSELPGILRWAIEGWRRLRDRGRILQPLTGAELAEDMEALSSPVGVFVRDRCFVCPGESVEVSSVYREWKAWCEAHGRKEPGTEQNFGRDLRAVVPSLGTIRRRSGSERWRDFTGIRLREPSDPDPYEVGPQRSADFSIARMARETDPKEESEGLDGKVEPAIVRVADPRGPSGPPRVPDGWGWCKCGKPSGSMYTRTCRACLDAESNLKG